MEGIFCFNFCIDSSFFEHKKFFWNLFSFCNAKLIKISKNKWKLFFFKKIKFIGIFKRLWKVGSSGKVRYVNRDMKKSRAEYFLNGGWNFGAAWSERAFGEGKLSKWFKSLRWFVFFKRYPKWLRLKNYFVILLNHFDPGLHHFDIWKYSIGLFF